MANIERNALIIEGLSGAGKTTAAQRLAIEHGYSDFNTGSLFRATAAAMLREGVGLPEIASFVADAHFEIDLHDPLLPHVAVRGSDVSDLLQYPQVTRLATPIGSELEASQKLEAIFNGAILGARLVVEGKHIGDRVQVAPGHRFFLTASRQVRALRKYRQTQLGGDNGYTLAMARRDIVDNDARDGHLLTVGSESRIIDTDHLTPAQVVSAILRATDQAERML